MAVDGVHVLVVLVLAHERYCNVVLRIPCAPHEAVHGAHHSMMMIIDHYLIQGAEASLCEQRSLGTLVCPATASKVC